MKKTFLFFFLFLFLPLNVLGANKSATLIKYDSLANIWLNIEGETKVVHLLAFEGEEGTLDKEINEFTKKVLTDAKKIEVAYDKKEKDEYNRDLIYLYVDDVLLQEILLEKGYGQVANVTDEYEYLNEFCDIQKEAIKEKKGIWTYPNIKEEYCNSGIALDNKEVEEKTLTDEKNTNSDTLKLLVYLSSGIFLLLIILKYKSS